MREARWTENRKGGQYQAKIRAMPAKSKTQKGRFRQKLRQYMIKSSLGRKPERAVLGKNKSTKRRALILE